MTDPSKKSNELTDSPDAVSERFIANLKYETWSGRFYLHWSGQGGEQAFKSAMNKIESIIGATSTSTNNFIEQSKAIFEEGGFQVFRS